MKKLSILMALLTLFLFGCAPVTFTVSFDKGDNDECEQEVPTDLLEIVDGTRLTSEQLPELKNTQNYYFIGWFDGVNKVEEGYVVTKNLHLVAKWQTIPEDTISFDKGDNDECEQEVPTDLLEIVDGTRLTSEQLPELKNTQNYYFIGWFDGVNKIEEGYVVTKDLHLVAKWQMIPEYTIKFNNFNNEKKTKDNTPLTQIAAPNKVFKSGYVLTSEDLPNLIDTLTQDFKGWISKSTDVSPGFVVTEDLNLVAKWEKAKLDKININQKYTGNYIVGDKLTSEDIEVRVYYSDRNWYKYATDWSTDESFNTAASNKKITISYTEAGITKTATMTINIKAMNSLTENSRDGFLTGEILFGDWPQTIKFSDVKIRNNVSKQMGMFTYYAGNDGYWYCQCKQKAYKSSGNLPKFSNNSFVSEESADVYAWFKVEPIVWEKKGSSGDYVLHVSKNILMAGVPYSPDENRNISGNDVYPNNYQYSWVSGWLDGYRYNLGNSNYNNQNMDKGFLQTAFTQEAMKKISYTTIDLSAQSTGYKTNMFAGGTLTQRFFLLSYTEVNNSSNYLNDSARIKTATDFALANGASWYLNGGSYKGRWFLRSPFHQSESSVRCVDVDGDLLGEDIGGGSDGYTGFVDDTHIGIVPAFKMKSN